MSEMFLKSLKLINFRNYSNFYFQFDKAIIILIGNNAQGKSNFLESIYFLATAKSPKAEKDEELIRWGEDILRLEGEVNEQLTINNKQFTNLEIVVQRVENQLKKRVKVNGIARRVVDYAENLAVVIFSPEDINLVTGSPSLRRNHLDHILSQIDRPYKKAILDYENVITRKNKVLRRIKEGIGKVDELEFWTDQQILLGGVIGAKREVFFNFINQTERKFGQFQFDYQESPVSPDRLKEYQSQEIGAVTSLIGPHRDDFIFSLDGRDLAKFGSRGEQRTAVLDLKLTEVDFIEKNIGKKPMLLLDDIFSELDEAHRAHVVDLALLQQTVIATVEFDHFLKTHFQDAQLIFFPVENEQRSGRVDK